MSGQRLAGGPGRDRGLHRRGPPRAAPARALGLSVEPGAGRPRRGAGVRRDEEDAHLVRRGQDRLPHAARALPDLAEVPRGEAVRRVVRDPAAGRRRPGARRRGHRADDRADPGDHGQVGRARDRRLRQGLPVHHQRQHQHRRRHDARLPCGRAAEGHGVRAVPPDRAAVHRHPDHRGGPRRGRLAAQQGRLPLPPGLRPRHPHADTRSCAAWSSGRATGSPRPSCTR